MAKWGGAIYHKAGILNIKNSKLSYNGDAFGGAINNSSELRISDSELSNNKAGFGGAINNGINGNLEISNSMLINNKAGWGGAINTTYKNEKVNVLVNNCKFEYNNPDNMTLSKTLLIWIFLMKVIFEFLISFKNS